MKKDKESHSCRFLGPIISIWLYSSEIFHSFFLPLGLSLPGTLVFTVPPLKEVQKKNGPQSLGLYGYQLCFVRDCFRVRKVGFLILSPSVRFVFFFFGKSVIEETKSVCGVYFTIGTGLDHYFSTERKNGDPTTPREVVVECCLLISS